MERNLKEQILKSASAVKRKVEMLKDSKMKNDMTLETIFKPIVNPLKLLSSRPDGKRYNEEETEPIQSVKRTKHIESQSSNNSDEDFDYYKTDVDNEENLNDYEDILENDDCKTPNKTLTTSPTHEHDVHDNSFKSIQSSPSIANDSLSWSVSSEVMQNIPFGVRNVNGKLMLGNTRVYDDGRILKIGSRSLKKTPGLKELLYQKAPNLKIITNEDLQNYKLVLIDTNAHKRNFDPFKPINSNKGFKYMNVIKPLFKFSRSHASSVESLPRGEGIDILKEVKKDTDLVYWDDPNELVERLKLLLGSWAAGNTGVNNEIYAIIEELHEAGIIKDIKYIKLPSGGFNSTIKLQKPSRRQ
ncbi:uncharacterized protein LOC114355776 [Ostrinia furnacalis]|uniref:uncharacterized protein LOC114355776 n=1 Tax=Ostrinia furnacalis TaxID=93504 RepID=UPI00103EB675|nr:uncharacterized protein LOC114355776 [Ostrinia furnacalis]